ncbi:pilus assembly protein [Zhongshania borealis]|uniref:PilC/PilY family type IV pilus protein n=1 Tax=Zhongshania borealis TaxID=889488 RepID=A0ABP7X331_9GAMM
MKSSTKQRIWVKLTLRKLMVFSSLLALALPAAALDSCIIQSTTSGNVGNNSKNKSYTFNDLEKVNKVVSYDLKKLWYSCPVNAFSYSGNRLTIINSNKDLYTCIGKFTVEGVKKDCTPEVVETGIAQSPLFLTQSIAPNILYILDDSGSMHFELMPGEIIFGSSRYIFPRADGVYGGSDYSNYVPTVDSNDPYNARSRSPQINTIYYDPSTTYEPWVDADGGSYPQANPSCALHNPETTTASFNAKYCRNLTVSNSNYNSNRWLSCESDGDCSSTTSNKSYWPATYFWYVSGDPWKSTSYEKKEIKSGQTFTGHGRENRSDCDTALLLSQCTYNEEMQNFANWYTYYRSRVLMARGGSGFAFAEQGEGLRVGFGSINQDSSNIDGVNSSVIVNGVRKFEGDDREAFFQSLYGRTIPSSGTPLRLAIDAAGKYFSRTDNKGPWGNTPGTDDKTDQLACRRNYTVLMTDGYWSGGDVSGDPGKNNDGSNGPTHTSPTGQSWTYKAVSPYKDDRDDTLADVAMYYWKNDLRSDMLNLVPVSKTSPAFWQHMVTYGVGLGVTGTIDPDEAFAAQTTGANITWPNPESSDLYKIDDLLHAGVNTRGGFFSAAEPNDFANELSAVLQAITNESKSSASAIASNSTRLDSGTLVYQASFNSLEWSGRILAYNLNSDGSLDDVAWDTNTASFSDISARKIFVGVGAPGTLVKTALDFTAANFLLLSATQQTALIANGSVTDGINRLNWLRGDKSQEGLTLRARSVPLGDIVNSDPAFVDNISDYGFSVLSGTEGSSYAKFLTDKKSRNSMLYVGANDGMLHGFNAATGKEVFAYMPVASIPKLAQIAGQDYTHTYTVDGSPRASDVYLNGAWKTVVVGSMGAGGNSVFALDVTNPATMSKSNFLWEFATSALDVNKLGVAMSEPVVVRLAASNKWVAIFGNGYDSGDNVKLFVVDLATGVLLKAIDTGLSGVGNGLSTPVPVDVDSDRITDYVYAGDLQGNLWKFDLTGNAVATWDVAFKEGATPKPLFVATDDAGVVQPITARPTVGSHADSGYMIYFGTGKYFELSDATITTSPQIQNFYGIRDVGVRVTDRSKLVAQTVVYEAVGDLIDSGGSTSFRARLVSNNSPDSAPEYGWQLKLAPPSGAATGERAVSKPILSSGRIIFTTIIPNSDVCGYGGSSWLMELDAQNGGRLSSPSLDANDDGKVDDLDQILFDGKYYPISGRGSDEMIKTPGIIGAGDLEYKYTSGSSGTIGVVTESSGESDLVGRQSWRQFQ